MIELSKIDQQMKRTAKAVETYKSAHEAAEKARHALREELLKMQETISRTAVEPADEAA